MPCLIVALVALGVPHVIESRKIGTFRHWLRSATVLVTFVASSALLGFVLQVTSRGYAYDFLVRLPLRYGRVVPVVHQVRTSLQLLTLPLAALVLLVLCVTFSIRAAPKRIQRRQIVVSMSAVIVALSPIPTAILAEAKLGGEPNQLAGPVWTLTLGCAVLILLLRPTVQRCAAAAIACAVLISGISPISHAFPDHLGQTDLHQTISWGKLDPFVLAAADRGEAVLGPPSLSVSPKAPGYPASDVNDILAGGYTPRWFIDNLLTGRYALVSPNIGWYPPYDSNLGRNDGSVLWKINLLLQMGYSPVKDPFSGALYYRPTSALRHLGWFAECFGPYQARGAGVEVRLRGTGGLVCIDRGDLHLSRAPAAKTEIILTLARSTAHVSLDFAAPPHVLRITPLAADDQPSAPGSDINRADSAVAKCLVLSDGSSRVTLEAVQGRGNPRCRQSIRGPVLEVPMIPGGSAAHVSIKIGVVDSPTLVASTRNGQADPFTLLDLTAGAVNRL